MTSAADVSNAARALARHIPFSVTNETAGKLYEAWLMLEIGLTLRRQGWTVTWVPASAMLPPTMVFRGAPGSLTPRGSYKPGYIRLHRGRYELEMHNSLQFRGMSDNLHEVDISIIGKAHADHCRTSNQRPVGLPLVALELKHYTGDLAIGLTRSMLMATSDLALAWSARQRAGRLMHLAPGKAYTSIGNIDDTLAYVFTTADGVGASGELASYYGGEVVPRVRVEPGYALGHHPDLVNLCNEITAKFI